MSFEQVMADADPDVEARDRHLEWCATCAAACGTDKPLCDIGRRLQSRVVSRMTRAIDAIKPPGGVA